MKRIEAIAASDRYIPEFLSLKNALDNSRLNQTLNTPAVATLLLMEAQIDWINANGGLVWAAARTAESSAVLYDWAESVSYATAGAMLGITRQGVHDLVRRGRLPRHPDGGVPSAAVRDRLRDRGA